LGCMTEQSLHNQLKGLYAGAEDQVEAQVDDYIIDIVRDNLLIEVQTGNFSAIKQKLYDLLRAHKVRLVYPVTYRKWVTRVNSDGENLSRRKSPKIGRIEEVFNELIYVPEIMFEQGFELEVPLVDVEEILVDDGKGSWRRKRWSIQDRKLISVRESTLFYNRLDLLNLLPEALPTVFTSRDIAKLSKLNLRLAQRMTYCFRQLDLVNVGKKGRSNLYSLKFSR
jgi:hypothetical protein